MVKYLIDKALDKMQSDKFWRGAIYLATAAGIALSPEMVNQVIFLGLGLSGLIHTIWHKKVDNAEKR